MSDAMAQTRAERKAASKAKRAADTAIFGAAIAHQRERYATAYARSNDAERREKARALVAAAEVFELDGMTFPTRLKKAAEALKLAVFMLDPKSPT